MVSPLGQFLKHVCYLFERGFADTLGSCLMIYLVHFQYWLQASHSPFNLSQAWHQVAGLL